MLTRPQLGSLGQRKALTTVATTVAFMGCGTASWISSAKQKLIAL